MISQHSIRVTTTSPALTLTPSDATLTLDQSWSPYAQMTFTAPSENPATLTLLDPRAADSQPVNVTITQTFGRIDTIRDLSVRWGGWTLANISSRYAGDIIRDLSARYSGDTLEDLTPSELWVAAALTLDDIPLYFDWTTPGAPFQAPLVRNMVLGLRSRAIDHAAGEVTIELASDEARLADNAHISWIPLEVNATTLWGAVVYVLSRIDATVGDTDNSANNVAFDKTKNIWEPGVNAWDYIAPLIQKAGLRLWCTETGVWTLRRDQPTGAYSPELTATETITRAEDKISRDDDYYTAVIVTYTWNDAQGDPQTSYDVAHQMIPATAHRPYNVTYTKPYPGPGAAARILRSLTGRGRTVTVDAVSDYLITPGNDLTVQLPDTPTLTGSVKAVSWSFPSDEMTVTTHDLANHAGAVPIFESTPYN